MSPPLVTVLLAVHKRLNYLREALSSIAAQTFEDYEVIVADDSGGAAANAIVAPWLAAGRLRYEPNSETVGVALSLRSALAKARGRYIAILSDDDVWEPWFPATLLPPLEADRRRVLTFCDHWIVWCSSGEPC